MSIIEKIKAMKGKVYWPVRDFLFPRQRWLTKVIPNHWCDKPELISDVLFAILIDFVEGEGGLENLAFQVNVVKDEDNALEYGLDGAMDRINTYTKAYKDLQEAYQWAKNKDKLYNDIWSEGVGLEDLTNPSPASNKKFESIRQKEEAYKNSESKHLLSILRHREFMWT